MSRTLIVGDLHIGKGFSMGRPGIGTTLNSRGADQYYLLEWIIDLAISKHANIIILTGDVFEDAKPEFSLVSLFSQWLKQCQLNNIEVHIVIGNHDIKRTGQNYISVLDLQAAELDNVFVYKDVKTIFNGPAAFTLIPFRDRRSLDCSSHNDALEKIKGYLSYEIPTLPPYYDKVVVGHLALEGSIPIGDEFDDSSNELMCPTSLFNGYDFVWMGHVHRPQIRQNANPYVAHIGSLDISDFGETDHKKIVILFDSCSDTRFETFYPPTRPLVHINALFGDNVNDTTSELISMIDNESRLHNSYVKVEIKLSGQDVKNVDRDAIQKHLYSKGVFHISSFTESRSVVVVPKTKQLDVNYTIDPKNAVKLFSNSIVFKSDEQKSRFIELCTEIIDEVE